MSKAVTSKEFLLKLNLVYSAQVIAILVVGLFAYYQSISVEQNTEDSFLQIMTIIVPVALIAGLFTGYFLFKFQLNQIAPNASLKEKLRVYQIAVIIRSACMEVPALLGGVATFVTGATVFLYYPVALLFVYFLLRPTAESISSDLALTHERNLLIDPNAVLYEV